MSDLIENVKRIELQNKMIYDNINKNIKILTLMIYQIEDKMINLETKMNNLKNSKQNV